jgi:hypothetical protein
MARACRGGAEERLSGETRARVLSAALGHDGAGEPLPVLFTPTRRWVVGGALPVLLAATLLIGIGPGSGELPTTEAPPPLPRFSKQGDQMLVSIANGGRQHRVVRSTDPRHFEPSAGVRVTDGAYAEGLGDSSDLVFFRID